MTGLATADRPVGPCAAGGARRRARGPRRGPSWPWRPGRWTRRARERVGKLRAAGDAGMATAEYAIVTIAAAGFAGLLVVVLRSDEVRGLLTGLVRTALSM